MMTLCSRDRLAIISHQPLFRAGLITFLKPDKTFDIVFEGASSADALRAAHDFRPDVVLFDPHIKDGRVDAEEAATIAAACPAMRLMVLSTSENESDVTQLLRGGIHGYVLKDVELSELSNAMAIVRSGQVYVTPSLAARLVFKALRPSQIEKPVQSPLSAREGAILSRAAMGSTNKEIAKSFELSEKTVKYYMTNIMKKLHVRNRVEAIVLMREMAAGEFASPPSA